MADAIQTEDVQPKRPPIPTYMQVFLGIVVNLAVISPGLTLGFSAVALPEMTAEHNPNRITADQASWVASVASIAMPFGCFISGPLLDRMGRKFTLYTIDIVMIIGWTIITLADTSDVDTFYPQLLVGRFITGLGSGLCSVPPTIYLSEIATPKLRGMLCLWTSVTFALGVQIMYILGYFLKENWKLLAGISGVIPVICIVLTYLFIAESPIWLQNNDRHIEVEQSYQRLQSIKNALKRNIAIASNPDTTEQNKLLKNGNSKVTVVPAQHSGSVYNETCVRQENFSFVEKLLEKLKYFIEPECYKPFGIMMCYFFFQQFSGVFVIVYYAVDVVKEAGVEIDPYIAAIMIGTVRSVVAIIVSLIANRLGRRPPSIISGAGMTICMVILTIYLYVIGPIIPDISNSAPQNNSTLITTNSSILTYNDDREDMLDLLTHSSNTTLPSLTPSQTYIRDNFQWLPLVMLMLYFCTSTFGFLTIPFAMIGEVYPLKIRGFAGGLTGFICYTFSFFVVKFYPTMLFNFGRPGLFSFYAAMSLCGTIFIALFLPETKGKTLQEIQDGFKGRQRCTHNGPGQGIGTNCIENDENHSKGIADVV